MAGSGNKAYIDKDGSNSVGKSRKVDRVGRQDGSDGKSASYTTTLHHSCSLGNGIRRRRSVVLSASCVPRKAGSGGGRDVRKWRSQPLPTRHCDGEIIVFPAARLYRVAMGGELKPLILVMAVVKSLAKAALESILVGLGRR